MFKGPPVSRLYAVDGLIYSPSYRNNSKNKNNDNNDNMIYFCSNWDLRTFKKKIETFTCALWSEAAGESQKHGKQPSSTVGNSHCCGELHGS